MFGNPSYKVNRKCRFNLARLHYQNNKFEEALALLSSQNVDEKIDYPSTERASFLNLIGMAYFNMGNVAMALRFAKDSLTYNPKHKPAIKLLHAISQVHH